MSQQQELTIHSGSHEENKMKWLNVIDGKLYNEPVIEKGSEYFGYDPFFTVMDKPEGFESDEPRKIRYPKTLPVDIVPMTLGEGSTPLVGSKVYKNVYIKNEGMNPTGNYKDRETALALSYVKQQGLERLAIVSSGSAALSAALYSQIYDYKILCYVPKRTSQQKIDLIELFGGKPVLIGDSYEETYHHVVDTLSENTVNITPGIMSIRCDGSKTIAYEIWEDLGKVPDVIICPAGNGSLLASIYHGFEELMRWGMTSSVPKMVCVQIEGADPIIQAFEKHKPIFTIEDAADSECEAIVANESFCSPKAVYAMEQTNGMGISVTDDEVADGLRYAIHSEGVFPELSSASVFAAQKKYLETVKGAEKESIVLINTASGLKDTHYLNKLFKNKE